MAHNPALMERITIRIKRKLLIVLVQRIPSIIKVYNMRIFSQYNKTLPPIVEHD